MCCLARGADRYSSIHRQEFDPTVPVVGAIARDASTCAGPIGGPVRRDHELLEFDEYFPRWCERLGLRTHIQYLTVNDYDEQARNKK